MKRSINYAFFLLLFLNFSACTHSENKKVEDDPTFIHLSDGFYYLNGSDQTYTVKRDISLGGLYTLNPTPIFLENDFASIEVIKEENDLFSLSFDLHPENEIKWQEVLSSKVHFIGFVKNNKMKHLLKIKGKNARNDIYLTCVSNTQEGAVALKPKYTAL